MNLAPEEFAKAEAEIVKELQGKQEKKQKEQYEALMKIIKEQNKVDYMTPNQDDKGPGAQSSLGQLHSSTIEKTTQKKEYSKCIESIQFSSFNPTPPTRKLEGDLFYLTVKTLDVGEKGITCCVNGFYVNNSVEKSQYNPAPSNKKSVSGKSNPAYSYTLIGCLNQISATFGKNLEKYINQILSTEQYFLTQPQLKVRHWASFEADKKPATSCS